MKVSVRLQQGLWASALMLSLAVFQAPSIATGQVSLQMGDATAKAAVGQPASQASSMAEARRALLKARQALALSDVATAKSMLKLAEQQSVDFSQIGDSPKTVQSMIDRQNQLAELAAKKDRSFNAGAASFLLTQAEALTYYKDFETAEMLIAQARKFPVEFNAAIGNPDQLEKMIQVAKKEAAVAQTAVAALERNDVPATPSKKSQAMSLLSQAQLAMDQEKWNEAKFLVDQAKSLGVNENEFAANEARPWQYELKIQNALDRQSASPVIPASYEIQSAADKVVQAHYDPQNDTTYNMAVSATESDSSGDFNPIPKTGLDFYRSGLQALDSQNSQEARDYFERAWKMRDELDGVTRQSVQDQLARLTMSKPVTKTADSIPLGVVPANGGVAMASNSVDVEDAASQAQSQFRKLQSEVFRERAAADRLLKTNPREALEKMTMVRGRIAQSQLPVASQRPLLTIIDRDLDSMQGYIDQNLPEIINDETNAARKESVELRHQRRYDVETQIQKLVEDFNDLVDERRFSEAQVVARQARDLDPDSEVVVLLTEKANFLHRIATMEGIKGAKEEGVWGALAAADEAAIPFNDYMRIDDPERFRQVGELRRAGPGGACSR